MDVPVSIQLPSDNFNPSFDDAVSEQTMSEGEQVQYITVNNPGSSGGGTRVVSLVHPPSAESVQSIEELATSNTSFMIKSEDGEMVLNMKQEEGVEEGQEHVIIGDDGQGVIIGDAAAEIEGMVVGGEQYIVSSPAAVGTPNMVTISTEEMETLPMGSSEFDVLLTPDIQQQVVESSD